MKGFWMGVDPAFIKGGPPKLQRSIVAMSDDPGAVIQIHGINEVLIGDYKSGIEIIEAKSLKDVKEDCYSVKS